MNEQNQEPKSLDELAAEADEIETGADAATEEVGEVEALKAERDEFKDRFMRALADA